MFATEKVQSSEELGSLNKKYSEILEEKKVANSLIIGRKTVASYNNYNLQYCIIYKL